MTGLCSSVPQELFLKYTVCVYLYVHVCVFKCFFGSWSISVVHLKMGTLSVFHGCIFQVRLVKNHLLQTSCQRLEMTAGGRIYYQGNQKPDFPSCRHISGPGDKEI